MTLFKATALSLLGAGSFFWAACDTPSANGNADAAGDKGAPSSEGAAQAEESAEWMTDYDRAVELAGEQGKPVLVNFTGSDWCPPCMQLKKDVFSTEEFNAYAGRKLVLVELDFPRDKEQSEEVVEQNFRLQEEYSIEGYPTLVVLDSQGQEQKRHVGYMPGGPSALTGWIDE